MKILRVKGNASVWSAALCAMTLIGPNAAQADYAWQKTFGGTGDDWAFDVEQTRDGGFIMAGHTNSFSSSDDVYLIKTDARGEMEWSTHFGTSTHESARAVKQTSDDGYVVAGDVAMITGTAGFVAKVDEAGQREWTRTLRPDVYVFPECVLQSDDGGYVVGGSADDADFEASRLFLTRFDAMGNEEWTRLYPPESSIYALSGSSCALAPDGGYLIAGTRFEQFFLGLADAFLLKTDAAGTEEWRRVIGEPSAFELGDSVEPTTDGGYVLAGISQRGTIDAYLVKTDGLGQTLWSNTFGSTRSDSANGVAETFDGGYVIAGSTESFGAGDDDIYIVRTDPNGNGLWSKTFGGAGMDVGLGMDYTDEGGIVVAGYTHSFGAGAADVYLVYYDFPACDLTSDGAFDTDDVRRWRLGCWLGAPPWACDLDGDETVDWIDFLRYLGRCWTRPPDGPP